MRRLLGVVFAALAATLFALSTGEALAGNVRCGDTITQDTTLDSNLLNCPGDGLVVGAANITIDLDGHRITGSGSGYGIRNFLTPKPPPCTQDECWPGAGFPGLSVKNGTIDGFAKAIYAVGDHETFHHLRVTGTLAACCYGKNSAAIPVDTEVVDSRVLGGVQVGVNSRVDGSRVVDGNLGIMGGMVSRNVVVRGYVAQGQMYRTHLGAGPIVVTGNAIRGGGVSVPASPSAQIDHNTIDGGIYATLLDEAPAPLDISANRIRSSSQDGIRISGEWCSTITENLISGNAANGIYLTGGCPTNSTFCTSVTRNRIYGNTLDGVFAASTNSSGCVLGRRFADNTIARNNANGLNIATGSLPVLIEDNATNRNSEDGIHVSSSNATIAENSASWNGSLGIRALSGTLGGGNFAKHNGDSAQCAPASLCGNRRP